MRLAHVAATDNSDAYFAHLATFMIHIATGCKIDNVKHNTSST
jgi:hypothetical protein